MLTTLFHFSSRWSLQPEIVQHGTFTVLQKLLQYTPLESLSKVFIKCVLIQLLSSTAHSMSNTVQINNEEALSLLIASSSKSPVLATIEVLLLVKCLILYEDNKHVLLEQGIMEYLTPLVDDESIQQHAAELIYSLMSPSCCAESQAASQETIQDFSFDINPLQG